jgi:hypothetical protein
MLLLDIFWVHGYLVGEWVFLVVMAGSANGLLRLTLVVMAGSAKRVQTWRPPRPVTSDSMCIEY